MCFVIKQTGEIMKTLKLVQIVGVLILLFGVIVMAGAKEHYGTFFALLGLLIYAVARLTTWVKSDKEF